MMFLDTFGIAPSSRLMLYCVCVFFFMFFLERFKGTKILTLETITHQLSPHQLVSLRDKYPRGTPRPLVFEFREGLPTFLGAP